MASTTSIKGPGEARKYDGSKLRIGIVHARWNERIVSALVAGTVAALKAHGVAPDNILLQSVPGSYELPFAAQKMYLASQQQGVLGGGGGGIIGAAGGGLVSAATDLLGGSASDLLAPAEKTDGVPETGLAGSRAPLDAVVAIGALVKGATMHFEYISEAVSQGLMRVQLETGCPVVFGLLTLLTEEQGLERAGIDEAGKGHNHGEDWGAAAVELGMKRKGWSEGRFFE